MNQGWVAVCIKKIFASILPIVQNSGMFLGGTYKKDNILKQDHNL
jgi:hypothetical protein